MERRIEGGESSFLLPYLAEDAAESRVQFGHTRADEHGVSRTPLGLLPTKLSDERIHTQQEGVEAARVQGERLSRLLTGFGVTLQLDKDAAQQDMRLRLVRVGHQIGPGDRLGVALSRCLTQCSGAPEGQVGGGGRTGCGCVEHIHRPVGPLPVHVLPRDCDADLDAGREVGQRLLRGRCGCGRAEQAVEDGDAPGCGGCITRITGKHYVECVEGGLMVMACR